MQNNPSENGPKRFLLFRLPRLTRLAIYLPLLGLAFVFGLRQVEMMLTYHPVGYKPGPEWALPPNGEEVWINVGSGQRVNAWFLKSVLQPATATVLYCHGNGGNLTNVGWVGAALTKAGFDVLLMDYRGYGRSDGSLTDERGLNADGEAAYDYLLTQRGVPPEKLALYGQSLGTTVAIDVASRRICGALVVESGLSSATEMGEHALPILPHWLHFLGVNRFESARKIAQVKCPVLVAHGTRDETVPVEQGRKLYAAAHEPKQLLIIEGGDHNLAGGQGDPYLRRVFSFIRESVETRSVAIPVTR